MTFLTPSGASCPVAPGQQVEIIFADGSRYIGPMAHGPMDWLAGFIQGETGYNGDKFASSWVWAHFGDCVPVARYRLIGDLSMEHLRRIAAAPGPLPGEGLSGILPVGPAPAATTPAATLLPVAGGLSFHPSAQRGVSVAGRLPAASRIATDCTTGPGSVAEPAQPLHPAL